MFGWWALAVVIAVGNISADPGNWLIGASMFRLGAPGSCTLEWATVICSVLGSMLRVCWGREDGAADGVIIRLPDWLGLARILASDGNDCSRLTLCPWWWWWWWCGWCGWSMLLLVLSMCLWVPRISSDVGDVAVGAATWDSCLCICWGSPAFDTSSRCWWWDLIILSLAPWLARPLLLLLLLCCSTGMSPQLCTWEKSVPCICCRRKSWACWWICCWCRACWEAGDSHSIDVTPIAASACCSCTGAIHATTAWPALRLTAWVLAPSIPGLATAKPGCWCVGSDRARPPLLHWLDPDERETSV